MAIGSIETAIYKNMVPMTVLGVQPMNLITIMGCDVEYWAAFSSDIGMVSLLFY